MSNWLAAWTLQTEMNLNPALPLLDESLGQVLYTEHFTECVLKKCSNSSATVCLHLPEAVCV